MNGTVLVRYGELTLKSEPVRREFEKTLIGNIRSILEGIPIEIETERGRIFVETPRPGEVSSRLSRVPGIVSSSPTQRAEASMDEICRAATRIFEENFPSKGSFAVRARRVGDHEFSSKDIEEKIGAEILKENPDMSVDLDSPDHEVHVEIRGDDAYVFTEIVEGIGGLPVGTQGRVIVLFSGSVNSLVSAYLAMKRGALPYLLFLDPGEGGAGEKERILDLSRKLLKFHPELELLTAPLRPFLEEISERIPEKMRWIVCRRMRLRLAQSIAEEVGAKALVSSADINQISSWSLENVKIIEEKIECPLLYPLTGFDEEQISSIGEKIAGAGIHPEDLHPCPQAIPEPGEMDLEGVREKEKNIPEKGLMESSLSSLETRELR
ncbi:hypothetical protein AKJ65_03395 [candidate division MSBL1 archaeon SCGC-AAA259E19]|uniref:Probable tRNA sulfurtransferase n=2 Tax=candidate division MSBL1 TaxID=215777 RepID=A0A133V4W1_9EURY|nr:hypothetical protein AKJ65_03395 [candidate division MSBL1 archaeon SCGC-AAA259E19]KXB01436.1 hypothetical protein AKJ41_01455 [candidate division MSBL1 archaeon SCGC-AAA259O05]